MHYRVPDGIHYEPGYRVLAYKCDACYESDHYECEEGFCLCSCRTDYLGNIIEGKSKKKYDGLPHPGTIGRRKWIGRNAPVFSEGIWHLHAILERGIVKWELVGKATGVCKQEGRCKIVEIKELGGELND